MAFAQELFNDAPRPSNAEIARAIGKELGADREPTARAIGYWIEKGWVRQADRDAPWDVTMARDAADIPLVLECSALEGDRWPSVALADWIIRIRRAYPELPPKFALRLARQARTWDDPLAMSKYLAGLHGPDVELDYQYAQRHAAEGLRARKEKTK